MADSDSEQQAAQYFSRPYKPEFGVAYVFDDGNPEEAARELDRVHFLAGVKLGVGKAIGRNGELIWKP